MSLTVDDILDANSLRNRARHVADTQRVIREEERTTEQEAIYHATRDFLVEVLEISYDELRGIDMEGDRYNDDREKMEFEIDGISFRSRFMFETVLTKESSSFGKEDIKEKTLVVEVNDRGSWKKITSLGDLGKLV